MAVSLKLSDWVVRKILKMVGLYVPTESIAHDSFGIPLPYPDLVKLTNMYDGTHHAPEILYLGDSVLLRVSDRDDEISTLDQYLAKKINRTHSVACIAHTAYHPHVYKGLISILRVTKEKPKFIILPINMRSFSPQWDFYPAWQFNAEIRSIRKYLENPGDPILPVGEVSMTPALSRFFNSIPVHYPLANFRRIGQFRNSVGSRPGNDEQTERRLSNLFIFHYTHALNNKHPKLVALVDAINILLGLNIVVFSYVTPMNYQAGERYVGKEFIRSTKSNLLTLSEAFSSFQDSSSFRFLDCSSLLPSRCFFNESNATEHLNQSGREELSTEIFDMIMAQ